MLHLLDNPTIVRVLEIVMGGKVQVKQIQGRTVPAEAADRYTHWVSALTPTPPSPPSVVTHALLLWAAQHRDAQAEIETHPRFSPSIKVFTFPFAVPADGGCAAVVPVRSPTPPLHLFR